MADSTEEQLRSEWRGEVKREIHKLEGKFDQLHSDQTRILTKLARIEVMLSGELKTERQPAHPPTKQHRMEAGGLAVAVYGIIEGLKYLAHLFK